MGIEIFYFFADSFAEALLVLDIKESPLNIILPVGILFYSFHRLFIKVELVLKGFF